VRKSPFVDPFRGLEHGPPPRYKGRNLRRRHVSKVPRRGLTLVFLATSFVACSHPTGPSLSATILTQSLVPTGSGVSAASICCCHVVGTVQNTSTIPVDMILDWSATDNVGNVLGLATDFEKNVSPGATTSYNAAGIFASCSAVAQVTPQVTVYGLYEPTNP
jgi:hypothetical protein